MLDLRAQLRIGFLGLSVGSYIGLEQREVAVLVEQARNFIARADGAPAKVCPLAVERKVDTKIGIGMRFRPIRNFWEPREGNQDAGRSYPVVLQRSERRPIHGMVGPKIVGVNDQQPRVGGISEPFLNRFRILCESSN